MPVLAFQFSAYKFAASFQLLPHYTNILYLFYHEQKLASDSLSFTRPLIISTTTPPAPWRHTRWNSAKQPRMCTGNGNVKSMIFRTTVFQYSLSRFRPTYRIPQKQDPEDMEIHPQRATQEFDPEILDEYSALDMYIKAMGINGVFFINTNGERSICRDNKYHFRSECCSFILEISRSREIEPQIIFSLRLFILVKLYD